MKHKSILNLKATRAPQQTVYLQTFLGINTLLGLGFYASDTVKKAVNRATFV